MSLHSKEVFMKRAMFLIPAVLIWLMPGCEESSFTGPGDNGQAVALRSIGEPTGIIKFKEVLVEPGRVARFLEVEGTIGYSLTVESILREVRVKSCLGVESTVKPHLVRGPVWKISCSSTHCCCVPPGAMGEFTARFPVTGRNDGLVLCARFEVAANQIEVGRLWLERVVAPGEVSQE